MGRWLAEIVREKDAYSLPCKPRKADPASKLTAIHEVLNKWLPSCITANEVMTVQDEFGLWVLLQAAQSEDRAFEQETVTAALRIYNDRTGAPELRESA